MSIGTLALRLVVGGFFVGHGLQKLTGAFGGPGLDGVEQMMGSLGIHPAATNARAVAYTETIGGAAIAVGAATPVAAAGLTTSMVTAIRKVHLSNGPWNSNGGYELNAVLIAALAAIVAEGPGVVSFDAIFRKSKWGPLVAALAIGAGAAASFGVTEFAKRNGPDTQEPVVEPAPEGALSPEAVPEAAHGVRPDGPAHAALNDNIEN
jgi:putative oxidoreductase